MKLNSLLEEIKSKIDIVEFISDYVNLKKSGQNYKGLCPFHSEKTPSFIVNQSKQIFHCFGCGIGGDVISFLMKHDNLSFGEAVRYIAKKAGIKITDLTFPKENLSGKRNELIKINEDALRFFIKNLNDSDIAKNYLYERGINDESIEKFHLGFSTDKKNSLYSHLKKLGYSDSSIIESGLVISDEKGYRDMFRKRIMFPIYNIHNDLIAFGGRVMDNILPKYLNTHETEIFKKGEILYGIQLSKDEIRKKGYAIIVEGYIDVIISHQYGFHNTVAPLGTALTSKHLQKLKLFCKKALLIFDSDEAGIAAARRSLQILAENDFRTKILLLPQGEDPDSFIRKNGSPSFNKMLSHSMTMVDFILNKFKGDKIDNVREALGIISYMKDAILADKTLVELSEKARINETVLRNELDKLIKKHFKHTQILNEAMPLNRKFYKEEFILLSALLTFPEKAPIIISGLNVDSIHNELVKSVFKKIKVLPGNISVNSLLEIAEEDEKSLITELSCNPGFDLENVERNINDCLRIIKQRMLKEQQRLAEEKGDIAMLDALLKEKRRLIKADI